METLSIRQWRGIERCRRHQHPAVCGKGNTPCRSRGVGVRDTKISADDVHDAHTVVLMREHNIRTILTADEGFGRFKNLEVVDPVYA